MPETPALRLLAEDADDLGVISAALQDAVGQIGDISYEPDERRITLVLNRFRWEAEAPGAERVRAALQFGSVMAVKARNLKREQPEAVVELLAVDFEPGDAPGGGVLLHFAGGGDLHLEVECIDAAMADLSDPWPCKRAPAHGE
ncbi:MAG TPA: DUF2948 family protein [Caulobacteraceae bacterium]|jgi:hypothetical protein|nr:DUF2948 family protein [Caulobacteraceae bacterium]